MTHDANSLITEQNITSKSTYLKEFNSTKNGPLDKQPWVIKEMKNFHLQINKLKQFYCSNCCEMWPTTTNRCDQCRVNKIKYTKVRMEKNIHF